MKKKINEEKLIAVLFANFHKKRKLNDWMYIAKQVKKLSDYYGDYRKLADKLGLHHETVREILKLLKLPKKIQQYVKEGKIKHEVAWRIASIKGEKNQIKITEALIGLDTHNARDLVRIFKNDPSINLSNYVKRFKITKPSIEKINLVIVPMSQFDYLKIKKESKKKNKSPEKFISEVIISDWLNKK